MSTRSRGTSELQSGWIRDYPAAEAIIAGFETSPMPMVLADARQADMPIVYANDAFCGLTGYDRSEIIGHNCRFLQGPNTDAAAVAKVRAAVMAAQPVSVDILNYRKDGSTFWNALSIAPMHSNDGTLLYYFATQLDASDRRHTLSHLQDANLHLKADVANKVDELNAALHANRLALRDKEILLHELHDRMKNNLQMFSALISMQIRNLEDPAARSALVALERRMHAVGAVHRRLHQPVSVGMLNIADVLEDMVPEGVSAYSNGNVFPTYDLDSVVADSSLAAPLALLLNEILANSIGVFSDTEQPIALDVSLKRKDDQAVIAFYASLPDSSENSAVVPQFCDSALSRALARQMRGHVASWSTDGKMRIELRIPLAR